MTKDQAEDILRRIRNMAAIRSSTTGEDMSRAVEAITKDLQRHDQIQAAVAERNTYLSVMAKQRFKDVALRAKNLGDGIMAQLEGIARVFQGSRNSIDYQQKSLNGKYFGRLVAEMEDAGVLRQFRNNTLNREVYQEMGELKDGGKPGVSGSPEAQKISKIIDGVTREMVARQNRAGAYIGNLPGYTVRQTHDMMAIRDAGRTPDGLSKHQSYQEWSNFTLPLLDQEKTFLGQDPQIFMRNVHDGLYTGIHGAASDAENTGGWGVRGDLAKRSSQARVLHFKDALSAFDYNEKFGVKDLREQVISDIHNRSRSIGLMENLGPTPEVTMLQAIRELKEGARSRDDAAQQVDSINDHKVMASFHQLTGINQIPANPNMARILGNVKTITQMAKMGGVFLSKLFGDKVFMQAEMAYQGISNLTTLGKQLTGIAKRSPEEQRMLRYMGVAMDGLMGNALSRYSDVGLMSNVVNNAQRKFFDINFLNYWTDVHKASAAELMAAHLGDHADLPHDQLPADLSKTLSLYNIDKVDWEYLRKTAWSDDRGRWLTPEGIANIPGLTDRLKDQLDSKLRTYFADRVDMAVPTPGASERRIATMDTRAGTPIGEAVRLMMLFKSFPITIANKIINRDIYGRGANSVGEWLMNDHQGKFHLATLIAMATAGGYVSMAIRDAINGKTPRELMTDGRINYDVLNESAIRGGGVGLMGDLMLHDYERNFTSFLETAAGPVLGQLDTAAQLLTKAKHGENVQKQIGKLTVDNVPMINLFYVRPVLNYYVLWNLEQIMDPNRVKNMQRSAERQHQEYYMGPASR